MGLRINQNIDAANSYRNLSVTQGQMSKSLEKLSSGFRINRAADDASGLAISEGLRSQVGGLKVGARNAQDGVSLVQTAEGALTEVHSMLQRMNDLAVQHKSGTQNDKSQAALQAEFDQLATEIGRIQTNTKFNGDQLFAGEAKTFQVGHASTDTIDVSVSALAAFHAGPTEAAPDAATTVGGVAIDITDSNTIQEAITNVSTQRAELGAIQNRFEHTINNVNVAIENLSASESRIRDTDMAQEMMSFTRSQILSQAGTAMLAQANQASQGVLSLLR
ncbi:flagellin [Nocardioides sp. zg-1228]|uniref:flagellin N-terminal helical domain-containing protein n=1 Tax=Nocardioides sp. zg-1228 TaxID=2763008 RepID=UPI001642B8AE|nr:flagellin [Nocardioides sp. zg-1228]MBC2932317.1 flagellin [Nocardioides sp. zg-1228]QSF57833.1 flagellin [Nocardioides sp. zg-1228]